MQKSKVKTDEIPRLCRNDEEAKVKTDEIPACAGMMKRQKAKVGRIEGPMHFPASENPVTFDF